MSDLQSTNRKNNAFGKIVGAGGNDSGNEDLKYLNSTAPIEELGLEERIKNSLKRGDVDTVGELIGLSREKLFKIRNIGPKSISVIDKHLQDYIKGERQYFVHADHITAKNKSLSKRTEKDSETRETPRLEDYKDFLGEMLLRLSDDRLRMVVEKRFGLLGGQKHTLEEIGKDVGVTRERIRQLEVKALKRLAPPGTAYRALLRNSITNWFISREGAVDEEEADRYFIKVGGFHKYDGSSVLDLLSEMNIVSRAKRKSVSIYSPVITGFKLEKALSRIEEILFSSEEAIRLHDLRKALRLKNELIFGYLGVELSTDVFLHKLFKLLPTISEVRKNNNTLYAFHSNRKYFPQYWSDLLYKVIREEDKPLHFTEVVEKVNELGIFDSELDVRRALAILIDDERFAHTGAKGTYGLTEWGIRKEMLPELIKECMLKAGFPLHFDQIFHYVSKFKYTSKTNVYACLNSNKYFYRLSNGLYWLEEKNVQ